MSNGDVIDLRVLKFNGRQVSIGISAPKSVHVLRMEILDKERPPSGPERDTESSDTPESI